MSHEGHLIETCTCGRVLRQCRCADGNKPYIVREGPCTCTNPMKPRDPAVYATTNQQPPAPGHENHGAPQPINPATGQHAAYWILTEAERAKGFVRPVRRSYQHTGTRPKYPLRDLTEKEASDYASEGYAKFEVFPESESPAVGRFWTGKQLTSGCGVITTMSVPIAETYARDPKFYGSTFCTQCRVHLAVEQFKWVDEKGNLTNETVGS